MSKLMSSVERGTPVVVEREVWQAWPIYWTAVWVGALSALAVALVFGLIGVAIGAHKLGTAGQVMKWARVGRGAAAWSILGSFLSFVVGGWATASVAGIRRAEPAMLHGALAWLVALPLLIVLLGIRDVRALRICQESCALRRLTREASRLDGGVLRAAPIVG